MANPYRRISTDDAAVLFVDHQVGLTTLVRDYTPAEFRNGVLALADTAKFFKLPVVLTTSFEDGPNGPIVPELKDMFPDAPYVARPGQINAWDNDEFVIHSPTKTSRKDYIGGAAESASMAAVFAQLITAGPGEEPTSHGVHCFVVPIRDDDGRVLPGVTT